jgi:hypothetical protein
MEPQDDAWVQLLIGIPGCRCNYFPMVSKGIGSGSVADPGLYRVVRRLSSLGLAAASLVAMTIFQRAAQGAGPRGKNYPFLVACADYDRPALRPLYYTKNDIVAFAQALRAGGFAQDNITLMHDGQTRSYLPEAQKIRKELSLLLAG